MIEPDISVAILGFSWRFVVGVIIATALLVGAERILELWRDRRDEHLATKGVRERMAKLAAGKS